MVKTRMNICLLESTRGAFHTNLPPLGLGYLASHLRSRKFPVHIVYEEDPHKILQYTPDLIGISAITRNFTKAVATALAIKHSADIPIVIGGVHISALPEALPECIDVGVMGDGERSFAMIVESLMQRGRLDMPALSQIPGIVYRDGGSLTRTAPWPVERILDNYAFPDRDIFSGKGFVPYRTHVHMVTSRGCPYRCTFCYNKGDWGRYRFYTAPYIVSELRHILDRYTPRGVNFMDDLFTGHLERLEETVRLLRASGLHRRAHYGCNSRANLISERMVGLLKQMNVEEIFLGLESASDRILRYLNKKGCTKETNQRAVDLCHRHHIRVNASFIIGTPVETPEDIEETLAFIRKNRDKFGEVSFGSLIPLPGTLFWDLARKRDLLGKDLELIHAMTERIDDPTFSEYNRRLETACSEVRRRRKNILNRLTRWRHRLRVIFWRGMRTLRDSARNSQR